MTTVAALYVDPRGPYPKLLGPEMCWDEARDARTYAGPWPVVAHPPCGPWTRNSFSSRQDASLGAVAFAQVRQFGGVLEQPAHSRMFAAFGAPSPGKSDAYGRTIAVRQVDWGHVAPKPTWLYFVGCSPGPMPAPGVATHWCRKRPGQIVSVKMCSAQQRRRTPIAFAEWLIGLAERARR